MTRKQITEKSVDVKLSSLSDEMTGVSSSFDKTMIIKFQKQQGPPPLTNNKPSPLGERVTNLVGVEDSNEMIRVSSSHEVISKIPSGFISFSSIPSPSFSSAPISRFSFTSSAISDLHPTNAGMDGNEKDDSVVNNESSGDDLEIEIFKPTIDYLSKLIVLSSNFFYLTNTLNVCVQSRNFYKNMQNSLKNPESLNPATVRKHLRYCS